MVSCQTQCSDYSGIGKGTRIMVGVQILITTDKTISSQINKIKAEILSVI